ncbi:FecR domain-containing protein [Niabella pedocola]|uniref:FecR domain-containing protein n=1 Tax=Niabella pedocola TaxID=1752077 RepID=A0ABS8PUZ9_9BACT|nr:FecR family protein [Niabella pedocola]MCD2424905.1 FecR domain-containing protein [Niabella pedocola]
MEHTNYHSYTTADFLEDRLFLEWVKYNTPGSAAFWEEWISSAPANLGAMRQAALQLKAILSVKEAGIGDDEIQEVWTRIRQGMQAPAVGREGKKMFAISPSWLKRSISIAAVFLVIAAAGYFFLLRPASTQKDTPAGETATIKNRDIAPGGNKAVLTLADGGHIVLDSAQDGTLGVQGGTKLIKQQDGQLTYNADAAKPAGILYNMLSTPRGGQYQLTLADGTRVWLNAVSSIRFPTAFTGKERNVSITGEVYFEVAHDAAKPFKVTVNGMAVTVLGTHFNINAYSDEDAIATTLLEGSVLVSRNGAANLLKPGQQSRVDDRGTISIQNDIDINQVVAWKNGFFQFKEADMETIMKQLSKWYNMDVVFEGSKPSAVYTGRVPRNLSLSALLKVLELSEVRLDVEGNRIIIKK